MTAEGGPLLLYDFEVGIQPAEVESCHLLPTSGFQAGRRSLSSQSQAALC